MMSTKAKTEATTFKRLSDDQTDELLKLLIRVQDKFPESNWKFHFGKGAFQVSSVSIEQLKALVAEFKSAKLDGIRMHLVKDDSLVTIN